MGANLQTLDQVSSTAIDLGMRFGPKLFVALLMLAAGYAVGRWAAAATLRVLRRLQLEPPAMALTARGVQIFVLALFAIMALQNLGIELLPLIAGLGLAGAGVALAMQGVLRNVVAGLTIIFTRPFRVGDYVSIAKEEGEVLDIRLFSTTLGHADLSRIVIPNRMIVGEILHNYGTLRQLALEVAVSYEAPLDKTLQAVEDALRANRRVLRDPAPFIAVARLEAAGIAIAVRPWVSVTDYGAAGSEINRAVLDSFRERAIALPPSPRELRLVAPPASAAGLRAGASAA
jgi:small conductance mechanosensitive channel